MKNVAGNVGKVEIMTVKNFWDVEIDYDVAAQMMEDDLREEIHAYLAPCTDQEFLTSTRSGMRKSLARSGSCQKKTLAIKYCI